MSLLDRLSLPSDIKNLDIKQLEELAEDIRKKILDTARKNGGHLSSNLGIVDTTVALYSVFDFPSDKLIFDVGHQCYAHKILSGRNDKFDTIRTYKGLSGFPDCDESEFDAFTTGHAGTSISAGLGYCAARDKKGEDYSVINIVGDGAFVNGMNLEALWANTTKPLNYIVILNDNGMSISKNKNGLYKFISKETTKKSYIRSKNAIQRIFGNSFITRWLSAIRNFIKRVLNKDNYFEHYGFKYVGVVDGNNMKELVKIISRVKEVAKTKSVFLHIKTTKGKGFTDAENHSDIYHGVGKNFTNESGSFALQLGNKLNQLIEKDSNIVAITCGMKDGTGLGQVEKLNPENFWDMGIAEEHAVTFAGGMAKGNLKPVVAIYSTFLQRSYDQILHDVCLQNLPVIFCLDRAGLVGSDGKTHQGVFDISYLSHIPNMHILAPVTPYGLSDALEYALSLNCPVAIRYPKNSCFDDDVDNYIPFSEKPWITIKEGKKLTVLAVGPNMLDLAIKFSENNKNVGVVSVRVIKPLPEDELLKIKNTIVVTLEENSVIGGFGSLVSGFYAQHKLKTTVVPFGVKDEFISHGSVSEQLKENGLTVENLKSVTGKYL